MARLNRAEAQERNRARVLAAARDEFAERGFRDAKVDVIAERAELTRGAVYSNFPGKRALYLAVLAENAERAAQPPDPRPGRIARAALGALARAWVTRLSPAEAAIDAYLLPEILADERIQRPFGQLMRLDALLLALSLEHLRPPEVVPGAPPARLVRMAEIVLTMLHGASQLSAAAPGFVEPFDVVSACEQL
ncbi:MAG TPA: helix-turn-helix domain-containing protein, partial [Pseudonocardiaceae bacterium]|nr:helix-turn-helix domain-containing protein [Pseudonocardiaceae bacterium]